MYTCEDYSALAVLLKEVERFLALFAHFRLERRVLGIRLFKRGFDLVLCYVKVGERRGEFLIKALCHTLFVEYRQKRVQKPDRFAQLGNGVLDYLAVRRDYGGVVVIVAAVVIGHLVGHGRVEDKLHAVVDKRLNMTVGQLCGITNALARHGLDAHIVNIA